MGQKGNVWIKTESERWVADGIITPEQCGQIQMRYLDGKASNPLLLLFAILGSLLIGAGIILVFATNWWSFPVLLRIFLAFLPLLLAQGICLYTVKRRFDSAPFREGAAVFLCLAFFAALALISQIFHTPGSLSSYLLICILFSLPAAYFFHSIGTMTIYAIGSLFVMGTYPMWVALVLLALSLPFFCLAMVKTTHSWGMNFLLLLLSLMAAGCVLTAAEHLTTLELAIHCGLALLVVDALFRKIGSRYFVTSAKLLAIMCTTVLLLVLQLDMAYAASVSANGLVLTAIFAVVYLVLRYGGIAALTASDLFFCTAIVLQIAAMAAGVAACLLALGLGIFFMVRGSKTLAFRHLNYGMTLVILVVILRFFDFSMGLLARGIVSILLGLAFLGVNLYISRKRKGRVE